MIRLLLMALVRCAAALAARVLFTTKTPWDSPAVVSEPAASKDFGFQSVLIHNTSGKAIDAVYLQIVFHDPGVVDEEVDSGRIRVGLEAGHAKRFDVFLGQVKALQQKAATIRRDSIAAVLSVRGADFVDGTTWRATDESAPIDSPPENRQK
jgi:hypothetical protein